MSFRQDNIRRIKDICVLRRLYRDGFSSKDERDRLYRQDLLSVVDNATEAGSCISNPFTWRRSKEGHMYWNQKFILLRHGDEKRHSSKD